MLKDLRGKSIETHEAECCCNAAGGANESARPCCPPSAAFAQPLSTVAGGDDCCCGGPPEPPASPHARPGYAIEPYVEGFRETAAGPVPAVGTRMTPRDLLGAVLTRIGVTRNRYSVAPGLYLVGDPGPDSPVLASANYKLSFDALRKELAGLNAWILVLDSRGINVWCAAGKKLFSSAELVRRIQTSGLEKVVNHRRIIVPQLGATGVSAHEVKRLSGFKVVFGPVRARDIKAFLDNGLRAEEAMRRVSFGFLERLTLVPVELYLLGKALAWLIPALFILSGIGPGVFSFAAAWKYGLAASAATLAGILGGAVLSPALLPRLPGRSFSLKGLPPGAVLGFTAALWLAPGYWRGAAMVLWASAASSYLSMNFTGSTPFTSPSGVEKEMKRWLPAQAAATLAALVIWLVAAFAAQGA